MVRCDVNGINKIKNKLPFERGIIFLYDDSALLFTKSTENIQNCLTYFLENNTENSIFIDLKDRVKSYSYKEFNSSIEAFINELITIEKEKPLFNSKIKMWDDYHYLSINIDKPPYIKISESTLENFIYLGPFRNKFSLADIIDVFSELFKLPFCENETEPCHRLLEELCLGFCQNKLHDALPELLNRMLILPNKEVINKLLQECEICKEDLQFIKAEKLLNQISILKKYYKNILFAYTSNEINGDFKVNDFTLIIQNGMIKEIIGSEIYLEFSHQDLDFRKPNELLAFPKDEYDHRWIVFSFIYDTNPNLLEDIYMDNVVSIQESLHNYLVLKN
jgi:excinuclease UvrABC nuclease subunit